VGVCSRPLLTRQQSVRSVFVRNISLNTEISEIVADSVAPGHGDPQHHVQILYLDPAPNSVACDIPVVGMTFGSAGSFRIPAVPVRRLGVQTPSVRLYVKFAIEFLSRAEDNLR
jgi:hypothetical protein